MAIYGMYLQITPQSNTNRPDRPAQASETDPHTALRAEIARLDQENWHARNQSRITKTGRARMDRLHRRATELSTQLPETRAARTARALKTEMMRRKFERGRALFEKRQAEPLARARAALAVLTDPALPPALHRQIDTVIGEIDRHTAQMARFGPADGIPEAMIRLLPVAERP